MHAYIHTYIHAHAHTHMSKAKMSQYIQLQACSGKELKKMFLQHGSFASLEIRIKKKHIDSQSRAKSGGWYTRGQLEGQQQWTKTQPQFCNMSWKCP